MKTTISKKQKFHLDNYGESLAEFLKLTDNKIMIQRNTGEMVSIYNQFYFCPLCLENFFLFRNGEYFETRPFSEDHFPPESVGGKQTILVCKQCNESYGTKIDWALKEYLKSQAFLKKEENASYPIKFSYNGIPGNYKIETVWENGNMVQKIPFKSYPHIKKWMFDLNKSNWEFKMRISIPSEQVICKALLRAAYLFCFTNWGYEFAYSHTGFQLRNILNGNEEHPLSNFGVFGDVGSDLPTGFYFISDPKEIQAFQVMFKITLEGLPIGYKIFVIIPGYTEEAWLNLENFRPWIEKKEADTKIIKLYSDCVKRRLYTNYMGTWNTLKTK